MAKFAVLFAAAMAFHATLAGISGNQQSQWVRGLMTKMQENTNDASTLIQNAPIDSNQAKRALESQINEWVHKIEKAIHHLERAIQHNQGSQGTETLDQIVLRLSDITHSMRQALVGDHSQMKNKLKTHLQDVLAETLKLSEIAMQHLQKDQQNQDNIWEELEDVMEELLDATRQLRIRRNLQIKNQQEIKSKIQSVISELSTVIQSISSNDQETAQELSHQIHELCHRLERMIHLLRRDAHNRLDGENRNIIMQIANKLMEIRIVLDQVAKSEGKSNAQAWITEMKNELKSKMTDMGVQMERLVQLLKTGNESSQDVQDMNNLIRNVLADTMAEARRMQWQLENINVN